MTKLIKQEDHKEILGVPHTRIRCCECKEKIWVNDNVIALGLPVLCKDCMQDGATCEGNPYPAIPESESRYEGYTEEDE